MQARVLHIGKPEIPLSTSISITSSMPASGVAKTAGDDITSLAVSSSKLFSSCGPAGRSQVSTAHKHQAQAARPWFSSSLEANVW